MIVLILDFILGGGGGGSTNGEKGYHPGNRFIIIESQSFR